MVISYLFCLNRSGGPSSPIDWVIENIEALTNDENRHQLLIGLNMYGMAYNERSMPQPMLLKGLVEKFEDWIGEEDEPFDWDKEAEEHSIQDVDGSTLWFPTLRVRIFHLLLLLSFPIPFCFFSRKH